MSFLRQLGKHLLPRWLAPFLTYQRMPRSVLRTRLALFIVNVAYVKCLWLKLLVLPVRICSTCSRLLRREVVKIPARSSSGWSWCLSVWPAGSPALPDHPDQPRPDDGGALGQRQEHGLARSSEGFGETGGCGGCGPYHRPQGHQQRPPLRNPGPQYQGMDRWAVHARSKEVSSL